MAVRLKQTRSGARSQALPALPGNLFLAALPPVQFVGGRAGRAGRAWERAPERVCLSRLSMTAMPLSPLELYVIYDLNSEDKIFCIPGF